MLSIEEIKLLIEKLEKAKKEDLEKLIETNLKILKDIAVAVDATNQQEINRLDKTPQWFNLDLEKKRELTNVPPLLYNQIVLKIRQFAKTNIYNSLEIGPGNCMFAKEFRSWRLNYFLDVLPQIEEKLRRRFKPGHQKNIRFFSTRDFECSNIPQGSCNFVFSWDTFVFFTQNLIQHYLNSIKRVLIPGGYVFIQYADCQNDFDLKEAKRGYWNYNTKPAMEKIIQESGYKVIEMGQFKEGNSYAIFQKPGKQNPVLYKFSEITID